MIPRRLARRTPRTTDFKTRAAVKRITCLNYIKISIIAGHVLRKEDILVGIQSPTTTSALKALKKSILTHPEEGRDNVSMKSLAVQAWSL